MNRLAVLSTVLVGILALAGPAFAADGCDGCRQAADSCNRRIFEISKILRHHMDCEFPEHRCAFPLRWDCEPCIAMPCHECPVPCAGIEREICIEPPCHRPALALRPVECCICGVELTGSKDLIVVCEHCRSEE